MKKKLALIWVLCMALMALPTFAMAEMSERGHLSYGANLSWSTDEEWWPTEFWMALEDMLNADVELIEYDNDTLNLALAGGDMADIVMVNTANTVLDGGLAVAMDDYLEEYGQNITLDRYKVRNALLREFCSSGDGKLYFHTPNTGAEDMTGGTTT